MEKSWMLFALAFAAGAALAAGWETAAEPRLYGVTFADYEDGEPLSNDKGVAGGVWQTAGGERTAANSNVGGRKCMTCDSANLLFNPQPGLEGPKVSKASLFLPGNQSLSELRATDKAAFAISLPGEDDRDGRTMFVGWTANGWRKLQAASVEPVTNKWYDISVWFAVGLANRLQVQYRIKNVQNGSYEPLRAEDGSVWLDAGEAEGASDAVVREIEIRGTGAFDLMSGRELPSPGLSVHLK